MQRDPPPTPALPQDSPSRSTPADALTSAQREFARLLGRLLADLWDREHPPPARPATGPPA